MITSVQNWNIKILDLPFKIRHSIVETLHHVMHSEVIVVRGEEGGVVLAVAHEHHNAGVYVGALLLVAEFPRCLNGVLHDREAAFSSI